jgi:hypothetical protein
VDSASASSRQRFADRVRPTAVVEHRPWDCAGNQPARCRPSRFSGTHHERHEGAEVLSSAYAKAGGICWTANCEAMIGVAVYWFSPPMNQPLSASHDNAFRQNWRRPPG